MSGHGRRRGPIGGLINVAVKGVAGGIGLASEGVHAYKENKREKTEKQKEHEASTSGAKIVEDGVSKDPDAPPPYEYPDEKSPYAFGNEKRSRSRDASRGGELQENLYEARDQELNPCERQDMKNPFDEPLTTEEQWDLDDAQDELMGLGAPAPEQQQSTRDIGQIADTFVQNLPQRIYSERTATSQLALPVILPQRRPKDRTRGFVRAYAPLLETCGIDQAMWMAFLDTFDKASAASPWLNAINLAGIGTLFMPHAFGILVSIAIQESTKLAMEVQSRQRTNTFLDKINTNFFRPRGLYCLVMTWKPDSREWHETVNLTSTISSSINQPDSTSLMRRFKASSGATYGEMEFPETAPLVFPELDRLANATGEEAVRKRDKLKKAGAFMTDYYDRRAQAEYSGQNPSSLLAQGPKAQFRSRYADPNHPASSGSLVSLVTGGYVNPRARSRSPGRRGGGPLGLVGAILGRGGRNNGYYDEAGYYRDSGYGRESIGPGRYAEYEYMDAQDGRRGRGGIRGGMMGGRYAEYEYMDPHDGYGSRGGMVGYPGIGPGGMGSGYRRERNGLAAPIKKFFKSDVLYLMVVNMPSEEEMAAATAALSQAR